MLPRCGSAHRPGGAPWQRTSLHVSSRRFFWIYAPERMRTSPNGKFSANLRAPLPFGQWPGVQPYWLGVGSYIRERQPQRIGGRGSGIRDQAAEGPGIQGAVDVAGDGSGHRCSACRALALAPDPWPLTPWLQTATLTTARVGIISNQSYDLRVRLHRLRPCLGSGAVHQRGTAQRVPELPPSYSQAPGVWRRRLHPQGWWLVRRSVQQQRGRQ